MKLTENKKKNSSEDAGNLCVCVCFLYSQHQAPAVATTGGKTPQNVAPCGCSWARLQPLLGLMEWLPGPGEILQLSVFLTEPLFWQLLFDGGPQRV